MKDLKKMVIKNILALDLEGTLVSNAMSLFPRPGLADFINWSREHFDCIVLYSAVSDRWARWCLLRLVEEGDAPKWFAKIPIIDWDRKNKKDLIAVSESIYRAGLISADERDALSLKNIWLVDDQESFVVPEQHAQWVSIRMWLTPYPNDDIELYCVLEDLKRRLQSIQLTENID
jgi:hypothetical protein